MSSLLMIYGATGYVGENVARTAGSLGLKAIVAGRDAAKLDRIASETGLERRAFGLDDPAAIDSALNSVAVVLNCAGPFKYTAACRYSPARVRSASPAECRAACPGLRSCASSDLDCRFLQHGNPATS
jgi:saccharopine dehydrogenase-like NADP-dependent oxidoreductase